MPLPNADNPWRPEDDAEALRLADTDLTLKQIGDKMGRTRQAVKRRLQKLRQRAARVEYMAGAAHVRREREFTENAEKGTALCNVETDKPIKTLEDAIRVAGIDTRVWQIERWTCSQWTVPMRVRQGEEEGTKRKLPDKAIQTQQYRVSVWLKRHTPEVVALDKLLEEMREQRVKLPVYQRPARSKGKVRRALEISICDPHLGLRCFKPQSDQTWSLEECEQLFMATTERLLAAASGYDGIEEIVAPIGNDLMHADTVFHTTTAGTPQPEMDSLHEVYVRAEKLILWFVERLRQVAPVRLIHVAGNHDRFTSFTLARLVQAFYQGARAKDVTVDASASPYKFWRYGVNLVGFEHGHSVNPIRLAALMANETRLHGWREARYCEWHLGDQHRKASGKPSTFEEQGVSIEYLPGLTAPNEWHRLKAFNWQKRGAVAFVWDHEAGPLARLQTNFDNYSGKMMGA